MTTPRKAPDWEAIELRYRVGGQSVRQVAAEFGITETAIRKRAKKHGWSRDLSERVRLRTEELLVRKTSGSQVVRTETQAVEVEAETRSSIVLEHRQDIGRTRLLFRSMLEELEVASSTEGQALMAAMAEATAAEDPAAMRRLLDKITSGPNRIDSAKKLTDVLEKVVKLEREAFGILPAAGGADQTPLGEAIAAFVGGLHQAGAKLPIARK